MPQLLTEQDFQRAAARLRVDIGNVKAADAVESQGKAYLDDGRLRILYEPHKFHAETGGRFDDSHPHLSYPAWRPGGYGSYARQWELLNEAVTLDATAALKACSWGRFQILGSNHVGAGFNTVEGMVNAFKASEGAQLDAFCTLLESWGLVDELRQGGADPDSWRPYARGYNGKGYATHDYHGRLAKAWRGFAGAATRAEQPSVTTATSGPPTLRMGASGPEVAELQRRINAVRIPGAATLVVDGDFGPATRDALKRLQQSAALAADGVAGPQTWAVLRP